MTGSSSRMLALLSLLQTGRDWSGAALAERLGVTPRTVRRDVDRLRLLGYRIAATKGPDGGYRLAAGSELPPLMFDDAQAVAIAVALQNAPSSGVEIAEAAERALATVRQVMPSRLRHRVDGIRFSGSAGEARVDPAVLEAVSAAVRDARTLRFDYAGSSAAPRRVHPHEVVARDGRWYLIAWEPEREEWRIYRLDRMTPRVPTGPGFPRRSLPTGDPGTFLSARFKGSDDEDRWPCVGRVVLDLPIEDVAPWLPAGEIERLSPASTRVSVGAWSWTGVLASVARFDAPFRIEGPPELADAARALGARLAEAAG
ncbi:helix-turn-helix transcriptional regulator [Diaminobutyricimonas aerilata]|nr:WYL domain-containing protein [Diaminobutyricimonas aerilata]